MGRRGHSRQLYLSRLHAHGPVSLIPRFFVPSQPVLTHMCRTEKILDDNPDLKQKWTSLIPQGKMGQPKDLMGPVTFLLSDASLYVTGADLRVDGGYTVT